jgi:hypothetical protein
MFHYESVDDLSQILTDEQKEQINKDFNDALMLALENGQITVAESEQSADFMLQNFGEVSSKASLLIFLEELSNTWPAYKNLYLKQKGEETVVENQAKISEIQSNLDSLSGNQTN